MRALLNLLMAWCLSCGLAAAAMPAPPGTDVHVYEIALKPRVLLERHEYAVADIAQVTGPDSSVVAQLNAIRLGYGPRTADLMRVSRAMLQTRVAESVEVGTAAVRWTGPEGVMLQARMQEVPGAAGVDMATTALQHWLGERYAEFEVRVEGDYRPWLVPAGSMKLLAHVGEVTRASMRMVVNVNILIDEHKVRSVPVWFQVAAFNPALVLSRDVSRHSVIPADAVHQVRTDVARLMGTPVSEAAQLTALRTRTPLRAGTVITQDRLEMAPDVSKGDAVVISARSGAIELQTHAIALDDGATGDWIRVAGSQPEAGYRVRVIGKKRAVSEGGS